MYFDDDAHMDYFDNLEEDKRNNIWTNVMFYILATFISFWIFFILYRFCSIIITNYTRRFCKVNLAKSKLAKLGEKKIFGGEDMSPEYCVICSDGYKEGEEVITMICGHSYHYECLLQWFTACQEANSCPYCKTNSRFVVNPLSARL